MPTIAKAPSTIPRAGWAPGRRAPSSRQPLVAGTWAASMPRFVMAVSASSTTRSTSPSGGPSMAATTPSIQRATSMHILSRCAALVLLGFALCAASGCGDGKVNVRVKLIKNGQPFEPSEKTLVTVSFAPEEGGRSYPARVKHPDGTFEFEMPAGKYKANVLIQDYATKNAAVVTPSE